MLDAHRHIAGHGVEVLAIELARDRCVVADGADPAVGSGFGRAERLGQLRFGPDLRRPDRDPCVYANEGTRDSVFMVDCDLAQALPAVCRPRVYPFKGNPRNEPGSGRLSDEGLRREFLDTVLTKAAGRNRRSGPDWLEDLPA